MLACLLPTFTKFNPQHMMMKKCSFTDMFYRESDKLLSEICVVNIFTLAALKFLISMLITPNMLTIYEIICLKPKYTVSNTSLR